MAESRVITKELLGLEDILTGIGIVNQVRNGQITPITKLNAGNLSYDASQTIKDVIDGKIGILLNIAALQAYTTTNGLIEYKYLLGSATAGDGGGGLFWLDTTDTISTEDLSLVFNPDVPANGRWKRVDPEDQISSDNGDTSLAITSAMERIQLFATTLTANRTVTLPTIGNFIGQTFTILRTDTAAFTLAVTGVATIPSGVSGLIVAVYNGSSWELLDFRFDITYVTASELTDYALIAAANVWTKQQNTPQGNLTWGANIPWNADNIQVAQLTLTGATAQLDNPTNLVNGASYAIKVIQDATGSRILTFGTIYDWVDNAIPDISLMGANEYGWITFMSDGTNMAGVFQGPFS